MHRARPRAQLPPPPRGEGVLLGSGARAISRQTSRGARDTDTAHRPPRPHSLGLYFGLGLRPWSGLVGLGVVVAARDAREDKGPHLVRVRVRVRVGVRVRARVRGAREDKRSTPTSCMEKHGQTAVKSRALEAASSSTRGSGWAPRGPASPWEYQAAQSRQARPEEAQEPSWNSAKGPL